MTSGQVLSAFAISAALAAGCKVGPNYERPTVDKPATFRFAGDPSTQPTTSPTTQPTLGDLPWWDAFGDPTLKTLIETSLKNNYDVRIAVARIEQARAVQEQARSQFLPQVGYKASGSRSRDASDGTAILPLPAGNARDRDRYHDSFLAALSVAWEVDFWGRVRWLNESALAQFLASEEARRNINVSLVSGVAQTYFELLELDLERQIAVATVHNLEQTLRLFQAKYEGGAASKLDVARAQSTLATTAAAIPEVDQQILLKENQLSLLLGQNPGPIVRKSRLDSIITPEIPVGLPSALLERRPDVREAEQQMRAANAQIGVSVANFFPRIGLSALAGTASQDLSDITSGDATVASIGASLSGPLFEGGALVGQYKQSKAQWEQAKLQYLQTVLTAFREVADALGSRQMLVDARHQQEIAVDANHQSVQLASDRYNAGKSAYFEVLDAQTQLYSAQNTLARTQLNQLTAFVQLYKALGGGWAATDADVSTTQPTKH